MENQTIQHATISIKVNCPNCAHHRYWVKTCSHCDSTGSITETLPLIALLGGIMETIGEINKECFEGDPTGVNYILKRAKAYEDTHYYCPACSNGDNSGKIPQACGCEDSARSEESGLEPWEIQHMDENPQY